jgi:hypothetical protein
MVSDLGFSPVLAVFERQIHSWECHPMPQSPGTVVVPAKARLVLAHYNRQR